MKQSINFDYVRLKPSEQIGTHAQPTWELSLIIKGEGTRTIGDVTEPFRNGEVVLVPPEVSHNWTFADRGEKIENITVTFTTELLLAVAAAIDELKSPFANLVGWSKAVKFDGDTRRQLSEGLLRMTSLSVAERVTLFIHLMATIAMSNERQEIGERKASEAQRRLKQIEIYISCNYKRDITIADIAQHVGMNRSALCTFFRRQTGKTIVTYLVERRLDVARHLLRTTSLTVQQVCYESGFQDFPHFCRVFKRANGVTPTAYRHAT